MSKVDSFENFWLQRGNVEVKTEVRSSAAITQRLMLFEEDEVVNNRRASVSKYALVRTFPKKRKSRI